MTTPSDADAPEGRGRHWPTLVRERENLPEDAAVVVAGETTVPLLRMPTDAWGLVVVAVDFTARDGALCLFAATALEQEPDPATHDGDVVVRLSPPQEPMAPPRRARCVDVEVLRAERYGWQRVRSWASVDRTWPRVIAPIVAAQMRVDDEGVYLPPAATPARHTELARMVGDGRLHDGEALFCVLPGTAGRRVWATVRESGIALADGRWFARPCGASTALGYRHYNGWKMWHRQRDGMPLFALRKAESVVQRRSPRAIVAMIEDGTLQAGDRFDYVRPRKRTTYSIVLLGDGRFQLPDGRTVASPNAALKAVTTGAVAANAWSVWTRASDGRTLADLYDNPNTEVTEPVPEPGAVPREKGRMLADAWTKARAVMSTTDGETQP
ncbi:hypothetical protein [Amycolatopsis sp. CA-230715]|uniref:restriction system modified-DNA reader domain-containing protein n=1 Tax=Amycolatopsis sp. CA-230715 TaxID=2745196 RepID=UPI001C00AF13|nr:hypothetical protein [Amycolatopsis sp. CA-230715]